MHLLCQELVDQSKVRKTLPYLWHSVSENESEYVLCPNLKYSLILVRTETQCEWQGCRTPISVLGFEIAGWVPCLGEAHSRLGLASDLSEWHRYLEII